MDLAGEHAGHPRGRDPHRSSGRAPAVGAARLTRTASPGSDSSSPPDPCSREPVSRARSSSCSSGADSPSPLRHRAGPDRAHRDDHYTRRDPPAMAVLRTIESKIEGLFEGVFGRAFRTHVHPIELARKLVKEMDDHRNVSVSRVYVPNEYTVYLAPDDRKQFDGYEEALVGELQEYLAEHARREKYALLDTPRVLIDDRRRPRRRRVRHRDTTRRRGGRRRAGAATVASDRRAGPDDDLQGSRTSRARRAGPRARARGDHADRRRPQT